jgi:hypothetical protein
MRIRSGWTKIPRFGGQVKYRWSSTEPSFFPVWKRNRRRIYISQQFKWYTEGPDEERKSYFTELVHLIRSRSKMDACDWILLAQRIWWSLEMGWFLMSWLDCWLDSELRADSVRVTRSDWVWPILMGLLVCSWLDRWIYLTCFSSWTPIDYLYRYNQKSVDEYRIWIFVNFEQWSLITWSFFVLLFR